MAAVVVSGCCRVLGSRIPRRWTEFRHYSGGAALQKISAEKRAGLLKPLEYLIPLTYSGISYGGRLVSGLSSLFFKPVQAPIFAATKLISITRNSTNRHNASVINSMTPLLSGIFYQPIRTLTYFGYRKGKRKSVKAVVKRFLRLHCGLWLRKRAGYKKSLWKKSTTRKRRLRQEVFCNRTQSKLLDKMTTSFWKRRNWFINDPYQKYHDRTNLKV